jgi:biotin carboxyl carrier protein
MHRYTIEIDGRRFVIDVEERGAERFAVQVDGQSFDVTLAGREELGGEGAVRLAPSTAPAAMNLTAPPAPSAPPAAAHDGVLRAPMPGVILRVLVAAGAGVRRGQDLAVLEAMKMENIIRAPQEATVAEVMVRPGQHVGHGEALLRLEAVTP